MRKVILTILLLTIPTFAQGPITQTKKLKFIGDFLWL
jgi:hypothetical protein